MTDQTLPDRGAAPPGPPESRPSGGQGGASGQAGASGQGNLRAFLRVFLDNRLAAVGLFMLIAMLLFCFAGPLVYHSQQTRTDLLAQTLPPGRRHPLGTDSYGFDLLGRLMLGGQSSLEVGLASAFLATIFGTLWGAISGYAGGAVDSAMMRVVDILLAIPTLVLLLVIAAIFRPDLLMLIVIISSLSWLVPARLVRGEALSLRGREYIQAVRLAGGTRRRVIVRHIVPNAIGVIVVNATFQVADAILLLAVLSFLGLGLPPPAASWGGILSDGLNYLYDGFWWLIYPAGLAIVITVVSFNFIGDALRDSLDVRLRGR
jgi:peptide/nickel transport system permease protein